MSDRTLSDQHLAFGQTIRRLRRMRHLSQEQLAAMAHLDRTYVGGIERGERNLSLTNMIRLAKALNVDIRVLFDDIGN